ncbi:MAG TPA: 1-(5-phosphoribosyl)-5-[(5-phosphoribosylamino)methylideneamino]imidazole-4-carboxamide isomerase [Pyrinomonadaceae bacterium]|jgi:phosphoribosylformimino-5-aminoimidazole carboxamide ribotide isomerase|nr:1-(5-phosphoribosyl)-5-[(5-phosphoribosylamino)methylideneamino]imidazole-4-carboxamide isomerase [Pyrinomonadaceae bacterium]
MLVIPAIDLKNGSCVRLVQGRKTDVTIYDEDPVHVAKQFADAGARMIHVVDLDGAFRGGESPNRAVVKKIVAAVNADVEFGGGVRSADDVRQLCDAGVARVVLGTLAVESPQLLKKLAAEFSETICVGIDAREGHVMTRGWESGTRISALNLAQSVAAQGVQRIIYTDISRDGMLTGPSIEQTVAVARAANVRVTASGGVSSLEDIKRLRDAGEPLLDSVIVGKALYELKFKLEDAINL